MDEKRLPAEISYERWVRYIFDHPVEAEDWWWSDDTEAWDGEEDCEKALAFMTRLFESPAFLLDAYTPMQIDRGINFLISNCCSNHCFAFTDRSTTIDDRVRCIRSIATLFEQVMAPVYGDRIGASAIDTRTEGPTFSCYMFWDVCPIYYRELPDPDNQHILNAVVEVLEKTLLLESEACIESALHGIGHLHLDHPGIAADVIDRFLASDRPISDAIRRYAVLARTGDVI